MSNFLNKNFIINFLIILSIFTLDRFSKIYVIFQNEKSLSAELFESKYLNIFLIWNEGVAFGLLSFNESFGYNLVTIIIAIVIIVLILMLLNAKKFKRLALLCVIGGALGNFYDRVVFNAVPDFIDFHIGEFHWFIFNIADIFITVGILLLLIVDIFFKKQNYATN
jgi:signal peptidase II